MRCRIDEVMRSDIKFVLCECSLEIKEACISLVSCERTFLASLMIGFASHIYILKFQFRVQSRLLCLDVKRNIQSKTKPLFHGMWNKGNV
jgi:hypothetical protein